MKIRLRYIFILLSSVMFLYLFSIYHRAPHVDDAWIGEQVYWLNEDGFVKNVLMTNIDNNEDGLLVYHKAFVNSGLVMVKLFGFDLSVLKSVSLLSMLLFLIIFYFYIGDIRRLLSAKHYFMVVGLLMVNPLVFEYSFVFRPEIMLMTIGFLSFIFLEQSLRYPNKKYIFVFISSVLSALCLLVHLNGLIFVLAGAVVLLYRKEFKLFLMFSLITIIGLYVYFLHISSFEEFIIWYKTISGFETGKAITSYNLVFIWKMILNFLDEQRRYLHSPKEVVISLLVLTSVITGFRAIKKRTPLVMPYLLLLMISLAIIAPNKTTKYLLLLLPYFSMIILVAIKFHFKIRLPKRQIVFHHRNSYYLFVALIIYFSFSFSYDIFISIEKHKTLTFSNITKEFVKDDVKNTIVLAPMTFIFDEIGKYKKIRGLMSYKERLKTMPQLTGDKFFKLADEENIDYIILNDYYLNLFDLNDIKEEDKSIDYKFMGEKEKHYIFRRRDL